MQNTDIQRASRVWAAHGGVAAASCRMGPTDRFTKEIIIPLTPKGIEQTAHQNYYNKDDYNSNELEELRIEHETYRKQLEELLEEPRRALSQPFSRISIMHIIMIINDATHTYTTTTRYRHALRPRDCTQGYRHVLRPRGGTCCVQQPPIIKKKK